jgi:RNA polymerase sigma-70 factor (ECF subfamily)
VTDGYVEAYTGDVGSTPGSLLSALRSNDPTGWRRMVQLYGPVVYRWSRRLGLSADDSADAGQEVFLAVARNVTTFRKDSPNQTFRGWLYTITRSKVIDAFRRQRRTRSIRSGNAAELDQFPDPASMPLPESVAQDSALQDAETIAVRRAIHLIRDEFSDSHWQAFWHTTVEGEPVDRVAERLGVSLNVVYLARSRILRRLRETLGDIDD